MRAEVVLDSLSEVSETKRKVPRAAQGSPGGADRRRKHQRLLPHDVRPRDARNRLLLRSEDGPKPVAGTGLMNGDIVQRKIQNSPVIKRLIESKATPEATIDEFISAAARVPRSRRR